MSNSRKYFPYLFSLLFSTAFLVFLSPTAQACHPCPYGKTPGDQYCVNGNLYECRTCNNEPSCIPNANGVEDPSQPVNRCFVDPAHVPPSQLNWCDNSCPIGELGIYDIVVGPCTCPNDPPALVVMRAPTNGQVIGDYNTSVAGRQVRIDWDTLFDWGDDCNANDANDDFYELEITYNYGTPSITTFSRFVASEYIMTGSPGFYSWRIRADNGASKGTWSAPWTFRINTAPTVVINSPPASSTYLPARQLTGGVSNNIAITMSDVDSNMTNFRLFARRVNTTTTPWTWLDGTATDLGVVNCTAGSSTCSGTRPFTPVLGSTYWLYVIGFDATDNLTTDMGRCSGFPVGALNGPSSTPPATYSYCGDSSRVLVQATTTVAVQYTAFDASDVTDCSTLSAAQVEARKIVPSDIVTPSSGLSSILGVNYSPTPQQYSGLIWNSNPTGQSFTVDGITFTPGLTARVTLYNFTDPETYTNNLYCAFTIGTSVSGITVPDTIHVDFTMSSQPVNRLYIGYRKAPTSWYTVQNGDVFAGYNNSFNGSSLVGKYPSTATGFNPYLLQNSNNILFTGANNNQVTNVLGNKAISSTGTAIKNINDGNNNFWPYGFSYIPPVDYIIVGSPAQTNNTYHGECTSAFTSSGVVKTRRAISGNEHKPILMNASCLYYAISGTATAQTYDVGPGVAVVYVPNYSSGALPTAPTITRNLRSVDPNSRLLIITNRLFNYSTSSTYGTTTPTAADSNNIQLGVITSHSIVAQSAGGSNNTSIKVEGPLIIAPYHIQYSFIPTIRMLRTRTNNAYPAVIVNYNPTILRELTKQIRASTDKNPYGLSLVNLTWEVE